MQEYSQTVAIFGATSDIAVAVARLYAEAGDRLVLVGRSAAALEDVQADLRTRGAADVAVQLADFADPAGLSAVAEAAWQAFGALDLALVAFGSSPDQAEAQRTAAIAEAGLRINFISPVLLLNALAERFEAQGTGTLAVISSVAGDRGRQSNYIYGAAKGGLQRYLEGLRHRLHQKGINVLDIRPGFVATKLTAHLDRKGPLWATPQRVAADIHQAVARRRAVLYTPWFWRIIMTGVRTAPRAVFHRTKL